MGCQHQQLNACTKVGVVEREVGRRGAGGREGEGKVSPCQDFQQLHCKCACVCVCEPSHLSVLLNRASSLLIIFTLQLAESHGNFIYICLK